jgi:hypothetical protein
LPLYIDALYPRMGECLEIKDVEEVRPWIDEYRLRCSGAKEILAK